MDSLRVITIVFVVSACLPECMLQKRYTVAVPSQHCKPCRGFSGSNRSKRCSENLAERQILQNDTFDVVRHLEPTLRKITEHLEAETKHLARALNANVKHQPYNIIDLEDIEHSNMSKYLRDGNPVEKIIHYAYGRAMMLIAYLQLYQDVLNDSYREERALAGRISDVLEQLSKLSCKLYDYTFMFGVRKIKKNVCKYFKNKSFDDASVKTDYIMAVLQLADKSFKTMYTEIMSLESSKVLELCKYECKNFKRTLNCGEYKKTSRIGKRRRNRRKKGKGRKRNKNRKNRERKHKRNENKLPTKSNKRRNKGKKNRLNADKKGLN